MNLFHRYFTDLGKGFEWFSGKGLLKLSGLNVPTIPSIGGKLKAFTNQTEKKSFFCPIRLH